MDKVSRALRRHLLWRKVAQRKRRWKAWGFEYAYWMKTRGTICSCGLCRNPRRWSGTDYVTFQEEKARLAEREQLLELERSS